MDLLLHLGAHRTGTTTLQGHLRRNRGGLMARGVLPVLPADLRSPVLSALIQRPSEVTADRRARADVARHLLSARIARARAAGLGQMLISEENLAGSLRLNLRDGVLYPDVGWRLGWLGPDLLRRIRRVGFSLRSYDSYWASVLNFAVAQGLHLPGAEDAPRLAHGWRGWPEVVADIAQALPEAEICLWTHEDWAARPRAQVRFLTGEPGHPPPEEAPRNNESLPAPELRRRLGLRGVAPAAMPASLATGSAGWMPFDADQRADLRARYRQDLARIAGMSGGRIRLATAADQPATPSFAAADLLRPAASPEGGYFHGRFGQVA